MISPGIIEAKASSDFPPITKEKYKVESILNCFDLAKMLGFHQITISDGDTYTHQVLLK